MRNMFARDADGKVKHKQPCQTPGCGWPNWHICLDKTDPDHTKVIFPKREKRSMPESQRLAISESQRQRHAERRALTKERDDLIIKHYVEGGMGMSAIASITGYAQSTVNKVLNQAQREGVLKIRPKNYTLSSNQ